MKTTKIKGFFSPDMAEKTRQNILKHIKNQTDYGKNFTDAKVVDGKPIDSWVGELPRWDVLLTKK